MTSYPTFMSCEFLISAAPKKQGPVSSCVKRPTHDTCTPYTNAHKLTTAVTIILLREVKATALLPLAEAAVCRVVHNPGRRASVVGKLHRVNRAERRQTPIKILAH